MNKNIKIHESWLKYIEAEFDKEYMRNVKNSILNSKESGKIIYPKNSNLKLKVSENEFNFEYIYPVVLENRFIKSNEFFKTKS